MVSDWWKLCLLRAPDPGSPKLGMVSWNLNTLRFGGDYTPQSSSDKVIGSLGADKTKKNGETLAFLRGIRWLVEAFLGDLRIFVGHVHKKKACAKKKQASDPKQKPSQAITRRLETQNTVLLYESSKKTQPFAKPFSP